MASQQPCQPPEGAGLLIVGHGTRDPRGQAEFSQLVREVAALLPRVAVEGGFLELVQPDISAAVAQCVARGARRVAIVPLLLVAAGHARRDIPEQIAAAASRFPLVELRQAPHLGAHEAVLELAAQRYREALAGQKPKPSAETMLLVVGRGTNDANANRELSQFAQRRGTRSSVGRQEVCFLAMAAPTLPQALEAVVAAPWKRVVVQPHFLFQGELLDRVRSLVEATAARCPDKEFILVERLGADRQLAAAVVDWAMSCWRNTAGIQPAADNYDLSSFIHPQSEKP